MKKHSKYIMAIVSILLSGVMLGNFVGCSAPRDGGVDTPVIDVPEPPIVDGPEFPTLPTSHVITAKAMSFANSTNNPITENVSVDAITGYDVAYKIDAHDGLVAYSVGDLSVSYDTSVDAYSITDTITVDDSIALEQMYYNVIDDQPALGDIYADYYQVEIDYTKTGKVKGLYYADSYYIYEYDAKDRLSAIYKDGEKEKSFSYNALGKISEEVNYTSTSQQNYLYSYNTNGTLVSKNGIAVPTPDTTGDISINGTAFLYENDTLYVNYNGNNTSYTFDYGYNGEKYITAVDDGHNATEYRYIGDAVVWLRCGADEISYIVDNNLNYVGLKYHGNKYYFAVDPWGNVMGLVDCDGNSVVEYQYDAWGTLQSVSGDLASTLGNINVILNMNGIYDRMLGVYFIGDDIYFPQYGLTLSDEVFKPTNCVYEWAKDLYFSRSAVTDFAMIHDKVVEVVAENLKNEGLDLSTNLYAVDQSGNSKRLVDIYTLDYRLTPFSAMNLVDGNQVYEVIYHSPDSMMFETIAENKLAKICGELNVSYFSDYNGIAGTMKFNGQFIYRGYLIDYKCDGRGIVEYQVKTNQKSNYDQSVNIYDYDNSKYVCYVNNTFDLDFLDGVTIIPGISKEKFDAIDGYLSDYMQSVSGNICDQMMIYDDPKYYNLEQMNVAPDYWSQMNLGGTTSYLEIQEDGSIEQKTMPVWETNGFWTKLIIGAGVVLVTAVVATVAIAIPGANCVVVSICVGAAKGAIAGAVSGFAMGFVQPLINIGIEGIKTGNWDFSNYFNDALSAAADGFASGAIRGAIMGGIAGGLNPTYCFEAGTMVGTANGLAPIENVPVGANVYSYNTVTGQRELAKVTGTSVRQTNEVIRLTAGGEDFVTTARHPFYVVDDEKFNGYTAAGLLEVGDYIATENGKVRITAISTENLNEPMTVYNLTVERNHSYYVGENGLLVHNVSCDNVKPSMANRGSTGRTTPNNLVEKLAMEQVQADPLNGAQVLKNITLGDQRWLASEGWVKMQTVVNSGGHQTGIHFVYNAALGLVDDFKFCFFKIL